MADRVADQLFAYALSGGARDSNKEFDLHTDNSSPAGMWSDGTTIWIVDNADNKIYAYTLSDGMRDSGKDLNTLSGAGNIFPYGAWSDGTTLWVTDTFVDKIYSYILKRSADATLQDIAVDGASVAGFASDRAAYEFGVAHDTAQVTIAATATDGNATVAVTPADADTNADGHQVDLTAGRNTVTVTVTAEDTTTTMAYTVSVNRGASGDFGWKAVDDFDTLAAAGIQLPTGITISGGTMWVVDKEGDKTYAFDSSSTLRDDDKDLPRVSDNDVAHGAWSNETTLWVTDWTDDKLYAYTLSDGMRDTGQEFDFPTENDIPTGLWSDGTTIWVVDATDDKLYAYTLSDGMRDSAKEFDLHSQNGDPAGLWSDGTTIWVVDSRDDKLYAYTLSTGARDSGKDFNTLSGAGNDDPHGVWSDGITMWVTDTDDDKIYSYNMPARSSVATLRNITIDGATVAGFLATRGEYEFGVVHTTERVTIAGTPTDSGATVIYEPADADDTADGHQVDLTAGRNAVTITVTAADAVATMEYTVSVNRGTDAIFGWKAVDDFDTLIAANHYAPRGIWSNGTTMWVVHSGSDRINAYTLSTKARLSGTGDDFTTLAAAGNGSPGDIWSDGATMWVLDWSADKIYAYNAATKAHDSDKDIDLHTDNANPAGIWSDETTMWVGDDVDDKLYAYTLSDGMRDSTKDIGLRSGNGDPAHLWSDGSTIWVLDRTDDKIYAYSLSGGTRDSAKDFDTLTGAGNTDPHGIWSDGTTLWVADGGGGDSSSADKIYSYNMPRSTDATLSALAVDAVSVAGFAADRASYEFGVAHDTTQVTVAATATHSDATVAYSGADADDGTAGHQVDLAVGRNSVTITVTAADTAFRMEYTVNVNRGVDDTYGWKAVDDFDTAIAAGNEAPQGIWSNGTTLWVSDATDRKLYAYTVSTKARDAAQDFDTLDAAGNDDPTGIWSNGTTMWVMDKEDAIIFAYNMDDKARDSSKDLDAPKDASNFDGVDIFSDGVTMWVLDDTDDRIYAYNLSTDTRDSDKEFATLSDAGNNDGRGLWSDGGTVWVADAEDDKLYAYNLSTKARDSDRDFDTLSGAGNNAPGGIWSDSTTLWAADSDDHKLYSYNLPKSNVATASALTVDGVSVAGFASDRTRYEYGVVHTTTQVTIAAATTNSGATVAVTPDDANDTDDGHQVDLTAGRNAVTVTVTAQDGMATMAYTASVNRGVDATYGWKASDDFDTLIAAGNAEPAGIWSNDTTLWVANDGSDAENKIYAYDLATGARDSAQDFDTLQAAGNTDVRGIWSDGTTMWVLNDGTAAQNKIYAYDLVSKARDSAKDFDTLQAAGNTDAAGIWSDGTTMWVINDGTGDENKIYAYDLASKARDGAQDFDTLRAADNSDAKGLWSDETTMWVSDSADNKIYAYNLYTKARDSGKDFDTLAAAGNENARGIWSYGETMWVADGDDDKLYSYNQPARALRVIATLSGVTVDGTAIPGFGPDLAGFGYGVASNVTRVTVAATTTDDRASVAFSGTDADTTADGHQVDLTAGANTVTITVTAEDTAITRDYTLSVNRGVNTSYGWKAVDDFDTLNVAGNADSKGAWSDGTTMWVADDEDDKIYAYTLSTKARDSAKDFDTLSAAGNTDPAGIWSDETTLWVADAGDGKLYAYTLSSKARDSPKDFDLDSDNADPEGIWSNGTTVWVADSTDGKLYAYTLSGGARDSGNDIDLHSDNANPAGIWSNLATLWVSDTTDDKIYAYTLSTKARDDTKDFDSLSAAGNGQPDGLWSNNTTMWVTDSESNKIYSYNMGLPPSTDATLSGITVDGVSVAGFDADRASYEFGVAHDTTQVTIAAATAHSGASVAVMPADANTTMDGHQVDLTAGANAITVTVTAEDASTTKAYTVNVNRGTDAIFGWKAVDDFDTLIAAGNTDVLGVWSDGATLWVSDASDRRLYAYTVSTKARDASQDFNTLGAAGNTAPAGIWSNGETMWVMDVVDVKIYAYDMDTKARDSAKDLDAPDAAGNFDAKGMWSDGVTMWVADTFDDKIYAYDLSTDTRDTDKEFDTLDSANLSARGIWSDGVTMWVADSGAERIFAYNMETKARDTDKEFTTLAAAGNDTPSIIWSDGETMWAGDIVEDKLYSYNMPDSDVATLSSLTVSPRDIIGFDPDHLVYDVGFANDVGQATVRYTTTHKFATVAFNFSSDADTNADGHQVNLSDGGTLVQLTVTAQNGDVIRYRLSLNRGVDTAYGWKVVDDIDGLFAAGNERPSGIWGDGATIWVADQDDGKFYAYDAVTKVYDPDKDMNLDSLNADPYGMWSDGTTMWVVDHDDGHIYAYDASDGSRDQSKEIALHEDNSQPYGLWSDGETFWVGNIRGPSNLFAYNAAGVRQTGKEIEMEGALSSPLGLWSDGLTMWVLVDTAVDEVIHAYSMETGARVIDREFSSTLGGNQFPSAIWSDGETMWVADGGDDLIPSKVFSYNMPRSNDNTLKSLTVSPVDIDGFDRFREEYTVGVASDVEQITIFAEANHPEATILRGQGHDADPNKPGRQVNVDTGRNTHITQLVRAEDSSRREYEINVNRASDEPGRWKVLTDITLDSEQTSVAGIWSNGATMWAVSPAQHKVFAYDLDTGLRDTSQEFDPAGTGTLTYIWGNDDTIWVSDTGLARIDAYKLSDKTRDSSKDFTSGVSGLIRGLWSDGTTMWIAKDNDADPVTIEAFRLADRQRDSAKDLAPPSTWRVPTGIWSDGVTVWVAASVNGFYHLRALRLDDGQPVSDLDFTALHALGNQDPRGIWSDGATMWVADSADKKIYTYNTFFAPPQNLRGTPGQNRQVPLNWDDPGNNDITGYQYRVSGDNGATWNPDWTDIPNSNSRTNTYRVTGLTNGISYTIQVRALTVLQQSPPATLRATPLGPAGRPAAPTITEVNVSDGAMTVHWRPAPEDSRAPDTGYRVRHRQTGVGAWTTTNYGGEFAGRTVFMQRITGLANQTHYEVQVATRNRLGTGDYSPSTWVTPQAPFTDPPGPVGQENLNVGDLAARWTDRYRSDDAHPDIDPLSANTIENACNGTFPFTVLWTGPDDDDHSNRVASQWAAHVQTAEGAGRITSAFATSEFSSGFVNLYGQATLQGFSVISIRVRGQFDGNWGAWSEPVGLYCLTPDMTAEQLTASQQVINTQTAQSQEATAPTVEFGNLPGSHSGDPFTIRLSFSREFPVTEQQVRNALTVTGGSVETVARVAAGESRRWDVTIAPSEDTLIVVLANNPCPDTGSICTEDNLPLETGIAAIISGVMPARVLSAEITSDPGANGTWDTGETVTAAVTFSHQAQPYGPPGNPLPHLVIRLGDHRVDAPLTSTGGATTHTFSYTVKDDEDGAGSAQVLRNGIVLNGTPFVSNTGDYAILCLDGADQGNNAPARPTGLEATASRHEARLSWDDPDDARVTGYRIIRRDVANDPPGVFTEVAADTCSVGAEFVDRSVVAGREYAYRIQARNGERLSQRSGYVNVTASDGEPVDDPVANPPAKPTGLSAGAISQTSVTISWDDPDDDSVTGYRVLRQDLDGPSPETLNTVVDDTGSQATSHTDATVSAGQRYAYRVVALNDDGAGEQSDALNVATPPDLPARPTGLSASGVAHDSVTLSWDDPDDDSITGYRILRRDIANDPPGTFSTVAGDTGNAAASYTDTTVAPETRYAYRVVAVNVTGESPRSGYVNVETPEEPANDPPPQNDPPGTGPRASRQPQWLTTA